MKTLLYRSLPLLALVNYTGITCADSDSTKAPEWLVNVESALASQDKNCAGVLVDPLWVLTIKECATGNLTIHSINKKTGLPESRDVHDSRHDHELVMLKLDKTLDRKPIQLSNFDTSCVAGSTCQYLERIMPTMIGMLMTLKPVRINVLQHATPGCSNISAYSTDLLCTTKRDGKLVNDNYIRGAALVDSRDKLMGLGVVNYYSESQNQTPDYNTFLSLKPYIQFIKDTLSQP